MPMNRIQYPALLRLAVVLVAVVAAVTLTSVAAAGPATAKQQVQIAILGNDSGPGSFKLEPVSGGRLQPDSGTANVVFSRSNVVVRDGQRVEIYNLTWTLTGKHGSLTTRERNEWIDTGEAFIGLGKWKVVRGTGAYATATGGGRSASVGLNHGNGEWVIRTDGFLTLR